jgi:hypothetical protein
MANNLQSSIQKLASDFAEGVLAAIRNASLEEIIGANGASPAHRGAPARRAPAAKAAAAPSPAAKRGSKATRALGRRSPQELESTIGKIVAALKGKKDGLRSEQLQKQLGLAKNEIVRPIQKALDDKKIMKMGQKRSTTYFAK